MKFNVYIDKYGFQYILPDEIEGHIKLATIGYFCKYNPVKDTFEPRVGCEYLQYSQICNVYHLRKISEDTGYDDIHPYLSVTYILKDGSTEIVKVQKGFREYPKLQ